MSKAENGTILLNSRQDQDGPNRDTEYATRNISS